jgi:ATP-dependent Lon protease
LVVGRVGVDSGGHRAGIKTILAPGANRADIEENVPESVKTGIKFVYVEDVKEVPHEILYFN